MKRFIQISFIIFILTFSLALAGGTSSSPQVQVTLQSQSPDPVEPGQILTVKFKVENSGGETTSDSIVRLLPKHPFTIYGDSTEKNIGKLQASSTGADAVIVEFKLKVAQDAIEGDTELEIEVQQGPSSIIYNDNEFLIDIQTHDAVLDIISITSDPGQIPPGESATVTLSMKNLADSLLKDIKLKLNFDDADLPLAPYQSSSERILSQLDSGLQNSLSFKLIASPSAEPGLYKVPLNISYNDEKGNSKSFSDILAVTIGDTPKLRPFIKKSTVLQANKEGTVTLTLANAGTTEVKFAELYLLPSQDYQLISTTDYYYIGDIDSDDTESQEIEIFINDDLELLNFPVKLKYYDANNKAFQEQFDLTLNLYSESQLKKFGLIEGSNTFIYLLLIVLAISGYFWYRKKKRTDKAKK